MTPELPPGLQLLRDVAEARGLSVHVVDELTGYLVEVVGPGGRFLAGAGRVPCYPLNSAVPVAVARDKAHSYSLLRRAGFAVPDGRRFFLQDDPAYPPVPGRRLADALAYAGERGFPVFVKPNSGSFARHASVVYSRTELRSRLREIAHHDHLALVQELVELDEYRAFVLEGRVELVYRKRPRAVVGDGRSSIGELLAANRPSRYVREMLRRRGYGLGSVLPPGESFPIDPVANLAAGGSIAELFTWAPEPVRTWSRRIAELFGLRVLAIDFFSAQPLEACAEPIVLEVNGTPSLVSLAERGERELVTRIWNRILDLQLGLGAPRFAGGAPVIPPRRAGRPRARGGSGSRTPTR